MGFKSQKRSNADYLVANGVYLDQFGSFSSSLFLTFSLFFSLSPFFSLLFLFFRFQNLLVIASTSTTGEPFCWGKVAVGRRRLGEGVSKKIDFFQSLGGKKRGEQ